MKFLKITNQRNSFLIALMVWGFLVFTNSLSAQSLNYTLRESISVPAGTTHLLAVRDMDGDGVLDIVLANINAQMISVLERSGNTFVNRFTIYEPSQLRSFIVDEVDGDGIPEILSANRSYGQVSIWESSGDNTYTLRHTECLFDYIERTRVGDSDGDGKREFLIPKEGSPPTLFSLEADSNNVYVKSILLQGPGAGNSLVGGTLDLDGDGAIETVFSHDYYNYIYWQVRLYVYENGSTVFMGDQQFQNSTLAIGDTDGNGLGEIIGYDVYPPPKHYIDNIYLRIIESTGTDNNFVEVFDAPSDGYWFEPLDVDDDGRGEFTRILDNGSGQFNVFTIGTRIGNTITDIYNSGLLLQGFSGTINNLMLSIGDTNGDGNLELAVMQGSTIHILELSTSDVEGPSTTNVISVPNPAPVNSQLTVEALVDDTDTGSSNISAAEYSLDGAYWIFMSAKDGIFDSQTEAVVDTFNAPREAGIYNLCVRGTDETDNIGTPECIMLVIYNPDGGFVTGGGWLTSPEGAYINIPDLTGKANFGFVSKYTKGATTPTGETEFQFKVADLNFHITSYEWLVVNQNNSNAQFKGSGTINGLVSPLGDDYRFMVWAGDGNPDTFRIKIWWEDLYDDEQLVYDNGFNQPIGGGSIVVHLKN